MAHDRFDNRNDRPRWRDDERGERSWRGERERGASGGDDRGFFERAGDEISSWFSDEESGGRRTRDDRERGRFFGRDDDDQRGRSSRSWDRGNFDRDDRSQQPSGWGSRSREPSRDFGRTPDRQDYRPVTGDYGRSEQMFAAGGATRFGQNEDRTNRGRSSSRGDFDPHYTDWRERHVSELDRDYEDYRRENQKRFEDEFTGWRQQRQAKRSLLGRIREQMEVLGSDNEHVGTIDHVAGDRIILTKSDPDSGGTHHSLMCTDVESVEGDKVLLGCTAEEAKKSWRDESRDRALFEREDQGEAGPHMLDRSFEGTYR